MNREYARALETGCLEPGFHLEARVGSLRAIVLQPQELQVRGSSSCSAHSAPVVETTATSSRLPQLRGGHDETLEGEPEKG